jgi:hypothetical protein
VADLIARQDYGRAVALLKVQLRARPQDRAVRQQLAEVLALAGRPGEAVEALQELADDLARQGLAAQAIAALKRAQALEPGRAAVEERLAELIGAHGLGAPPAPSPTAVADEGVREQLVSLVVDALHGGGTGAPAPAPEDVRTPLFKDFSRDELVEVIRGLRLLSFEPGDIVVSEGEPGSSLFVVTTGRVKAFVRQASGHSAKIRDLREGDFFGEVSILEGGRRTATITCATRCELLELDTPTLNAIAARHPNVPRVLEEFHRERSGSTVEHMVRSIDH